MQRLGFLDGGGEVGALIRRFAWDGHPLGPPGEWPATLKIAVSLCLHSSFPTAIYWGPDYRFLYNDAWMRLSDRHPWALGRPGAEARADIWPVLEPQFRAIMASGEGMAIVDQRLIMDRRGALDETYWTYNSSPLRDEGGVCCGIINQGREVTGEVRQATLLRESEERLQMALDAAGDLGTWEWDVAADRMMGDERLARLYGVDPQDAREGAPVARFLRNIHPDDLAHVTAAAEHGFATGEKVSVEYRLMLADGTMRWIAVQGGKRDVEDGRPPRFAGVSLDISEVKRSEHELRQAKEEREFILALAERQRAETDADDVMRITAEALARHLGVNRAGFFQVSADSMIEYGPCWADGTLPPLTGSVPSATFGVALGKTIRAGETLVFGGEADAMRPEQSALEATGTRAGISVPLVRQGRWEAAFYLSCTAPRAWQAGEVALVEEVAQLAWDAVGRARAVAGLRVHNRNLAGEVAARTAERDRIWDVSQDMFGIADGQGVWLSVNPAWERLLGWSVEEIVGRTSEWLTHPDDNARTRAEVASRPEGGRSIGFENRFRTRSGAWLTLSWTSVVSEGRIYATAQDVSDRRELEERLRQSQKMEAVGQLTGGLAHDFNNLLTGMSGAMEMLQVRLKQGRLDDLERYILAAQAASARAAALTHRLLAFSRRQSLDPRPTDVNRLVMGIEELIRRTVGPAVAVEVMGAEDAWPTLVDPNQLENALLNLCINARDAMPDGGTLKIDTGNIVLDAAEAAERDLPAGDYLTLCVTDDGTGMPPEVAARAFDPFFTTKPLGLGTGLGLSMIYGFARQTGGHVRIDSTQGEGTLICLYLPRHRGPVAAPTEGGSVRLAPLLDMPRTVLVVDDEPSVRMLVSDVLAELGITAIEACDGAEAERLLQSGLALDLLITDVGLPGGMNGRQVADVARVGRPGLPVLFITGYAEHAVIGNDQLEQGMALVPKPFSIDVLAGRIREMIAA